MSALPRKRVEGRARERSLPFDDARHLAAHRFLVEEALVLDERDFDAWLDLLAPDVHYQVPVTTTVARGSRSGKSADVSHYDEDFFSLTMRVDRFRTNFAWAEDPPSRTRRLVTNVCCYPGTAPDEVRVRSSLLLFRSRGDLRDSDLICGGRDDVLRRAGEAGDFLLVRRQVTLDESVLHTQNLALFL